MHDSGRVEEKYKECVYIYYEDIVVGGKVEIINLFVMEKYIWWEEVNLPRMKNAYFLTATPKQELIKDTTIHIVDTAIWTKNNEKGDDKYKPSNIILLLMCRLDVQRDRTGWAWEHEYFKTIESSKTNRSNANMGHFGSDGRSFSYGNKGNFVMVDGSSVSQCVNIKFTTESRSTKSVFNSKLIEEMATQEIGIGLDRLCKIIPNTNALIAPIITTWYINSKVVKVELIYRKV